MTYKRMSAIKSHPVGSSIIERERERVCGEKDAFVLYKMLLHKRNTLRLQSSFIPGMRTHFWKKLEVFSRQQNIFVINHFRSKESFPVKLRSVDLCRSIAHRYPLDPNSNRLILYRTNWRKTKGCFLRRIESNAVQYWNNMFN